MTKEECEQRGIGQDHMPPPPPPETEMFCGAELNPEQLAELLNITMRPARGQFEQHAHEDGFIYFRVPFGGGDA